MRLQRVHLTHSTISARCLGCGKVAPVNTMVADLDGEPFKAYYCPDCVATDTQGNLIHAGPGSINAFEYGEQYGENNP